jgi:hypothetical protein
MKVDPRYAKRSASQPAFAASHRSAKHVGPGGIVTLPAPTIKSDLPRMVVDRSPKPNELRGAGIVHEMYPGPSKLKVEHLRHVNCHRVWLGKRVGEAQPIVTRAKPARIAYGTSAAKEKA